MTYPTIWAQCAQQPKNPTICTNSSSTSSRMESRLQRWLLHSPNWSPKDLDFLTWWDHLNSISSKKWNDLPNDLSPMRSTTEESNFLHSAISNVFKDGKSSSKITFILVQLDSERFRSSHEIELSEINIKWKNRMTHPMIWVQFAQQPQISTIHNYSSSTSSRMESRLRRSFLH